jgi:hypothetical protein
MVQSAIRGGVPPDMVDLVKTCCDTVGIKSRGPGLYGDDHNLMSKMTKNFMRRARLRPECVFTARAVGDGVHVHHEGQNYHREDTSLVPGHQSPTVGPAVIPEETTTWLVV